MSYSRTHFQLLSAILGMSLTLAPWPAWADLLDQPLTLEQVTTDSERLPEHLRAILLAGPEQWRQRALSVVSDQSPTPKADFELLANGAGYTIPAGSLANDFLGRFSDERLAAMIDYGLEDSYGEHRIAVALTSAGDEILRRPSLAAIHPKAHYTSAIGVLFTARDTASVVDRFRDGIDEGNPSPSEYSSRCRNAVAALTNPVTSDDFREAKRLVEEAFRFKSRGRVFEITGKALNVYDAGGSALLEGGGNDPDHQAIGLLASAAAFHHREDILEAVLAAARNPAASLPDAIRAEAFYQVAHYHFKKADPEAAIPILEEAIDIAPSTEYAVKANLWLGNSHRYAARYLDAAVQYMEVIESGAAYPREVEQATAKVNALISSNVLTEENLQSLTMRFPKVTSPNLMLMTRTASRREGGK